MVFKNGWQDIHKTIIALCEQVTAFDYGRIIENMGKVDEETLARITEAVQVQVGCLISITDKKSKAGCSVPAFTYRGLYVIGQSAN